ncbi:MAG: hypothetical protein RL095_2256 [Verrucomicrobiota bacterium]|jgi:REP element-mobilizing transposase RayT
MPQSLSQILVHLVFSTKDRRPLLTPQIQPQIFAILAQALIQLGAHPLKVGGHLDHVHLFFNLGKQSSISNLVRDLKTDSNKWMKGQGQLDFAWQTGYAAFSVAMQDKDKVVRYIATQAEHHGTHDFKTELKAFLERAQIPYDERYLWD